MPNLSGQERGDVLNDDRSRSCLECDSGNHFGEKVSRVISTSICVRAESSVAVRATHALARGTCSQERWRVLRFTPETLDHILPCVPEISLYRCRTRMVPTGHLKASGIDLRQDGEPESRLRITDISSATVGEEADRLKRFCLDVRRHRLRSWRTQRRLAHPETLRGPSWLDRGNPPSSSAQAYSLPQGTHMRAGSRRTGQ